MFNNRAKRLSTKGKLLAIAALFGVGTAVTSLQQWSETHAFMINATDSLPNWAFLVESGRFPDRGDYVIFHPGHDPVTQKYFGEEPGAFAKIAFGLPGDFVTREGRDVLIYPEGHLAAPGEQHAYRKGVWHLYADLNRPCVPVATNLGLAWKQQAFRKTPGRAVVEFLDPIEPGLEKEAFMQRLEVVIEARTDALVKEGLK